MTLFINEMDKDVFNRAVVLWAVELTRGALMSEQHTISRFASARQLFSVDFIAIKLLVVFSPSTDKGRFPERIPIYILRRSAFKTNK